MRLVPGLAIAGAFMTTTAMAAEPEWGRVIVMVNDNTGAVERTVNYPRSYQEAWVEDRTRKGFRILMTSTAPGWGATMCVSRDLAGTRDELGRTLKERRFFYSHPHPSGREAVGGAQDAARPQAAAWHEVFYSCGQVWEVLPQVPTERLNAKYAPMK
jgi:hypothetical protein